MKAGTNLEIILESGRFAITAGRLAKDEIITRLDL